MTNSKILSLLLSLMISSVAFAVQLSNEFQDSSLIFEKIKSNEKEFKLQKSKLFKKIAVIQNDSLEIYSIDKKSTKITTIIINRKVTSPETTQTTYWFINNELFKVIFHISNKREGFYFFSNNSLIYKEEKNIHQQDINLFLKSAKQYLNKGSELLKENNTQ